MTFNGVDTSYIQKNINFAGLGSFAIINASRANVGLVVGSYYAAQVDNARANGLEIGHYFFNGPTDPTVCANFFVDNLHDFRSGDVLVLDIEATGVVAWTPAQGLAFAQRVFARTGVKIGIYLDHSLLKSENWSALVSFGCWLWIAYPGSAPGAIQWWPTWSIWQNSSAGGIDRNVSQTPLKQLSPASAPTIIPPEDDMPYLYNATSSSADGIIQSGWTYEQVGGGVITAVTSEKSFFIQSSATPPKAEGISGEDLRRLTETYGLAEYAPIAPGKVWGPPPNSSPTPVAIAGPGQATGRVIFAGTAGVAFPAQATVDTGAVTAAINAAFSTLKIDFDPAPVATAVVAALAAKLG